MLMIALRLLTGCAALLLIAAAPPDQGRVGYVIDGDTFRLESGERIRIAGIDSPETHAGQAKCSGEIALGRSATARARTLLDGRNVTIMRVGRSYNRTVARVTLAGRDVGSELVATGVARWWPRWQRKPDWCAADSQGISRSGGTAKSPAAKWARIAS